MNTQHMMAEAVPYEPPRMTVVPIRATGMLCTSVLERKIGTMDFDEGSFFYEGQDGGTYNTATEWSSLDDGEWGDSFF